MLLQEVSVAEKAMQSPAPLWRRIAPYALGFLLLFVLYLLAAQTIPNNSDDASIILEGQAFLHGNLTLHGWYLPSDSFITTEVPLYALGNLLLPQVWLFKVVPALLYATTVVLAAYLAVRVAEANADTHASRLSVALCVGLLALPVGLIFVLTMHSPMHFTTIALSLVAFILYDRFVRRQAPRASLVLLVGITALAIVGDPLAEVLVPLPIALVNGWQLWRSQGKDVTARGLLASVGFAFMVGVVLRTALVWSGTHMAGDGLRPVSPDLLLPHLWWLIVGVCLLFHIDLTSGQPFVLRIVGIVLNGGFLIVSLVGFVRLGRTRLVPTERESSVVTVLWWAILCVVGVFLFTGFATAEIHIRYLFPAFIYAGVLLPLAMRQVVVPGAMRRYALLFLLASGLTFGLWLTQVRPTAPPEAGIIALLHERHLTEGIGSFWSASVITVQSQGAVRVRGVQLVHGTVQPMRWHADATWYAPPTAGHPTFLIVDGGENATRYRAAAVQTFGAPDHTYTRDGYTVLVWDHPLRI